MKILLVHNYYGTAAPSGENAVFEAELGLLRRWGHQVSTFCRHSDEIRAKGALGVLQGGLSTPWNPWSAAAVCREAGRTGAEIVHVHNTFPLLSPAIFHRVKSPAARVVTLHNYRLFCPAGIPMREGRICTECLDAHSVLPSLRHACYRGSRWATAPLALSIMLHRAFGTWAREVEAFITLTEYQRGILVGAGLPADRVHVKPNFYPGDPVPVPWRERGEYAVCVGRLTVEKGVEDLVRAWLAWGRSAPELRIVGDGPLRPALEELASTAGQIRFLGQLPAAAAEQQIASARLMVLPSICIEGFPMVLREAFALGTPVAVSGIGPLSLLVRGGEAGLVFNPGDATSLLQKIRPAWEVPEVLERLGRAARAEFASFYNEKANHATLMAIYQVARANRDREGV